MHDAARMTRRAAAGAPPPSVEQSTRAKVRPGNQAGVAQTVRAPPCQGGGRGFESLRRRLQRPHLEPATATGVDPRWMPDVEVPGPGRMHWPRLAPVLRDPAERSAASVRGSSLRLVLRVAPLPGHRADRLACHGATFWIVSPFGPSSHARSTSIVRVSPSSRRTMMTLRIVFFPAPHHVQISRSSRRWANR